jgi:hypothetical protein
VATQNPHLFRYALAVYAAAIGSTWLIPEPNGVTGGDRAVAELKPSTGPEVPGTMKHVRHAVVPTGGAPAATSAAEAVEHTVEALTPMPQTLDLKNSNAGIERPHLAQATEESEATRSQSLELENSALADGSSGDPAI